MFAYFRRRKSTRKSTRQRLGAWKPRLEVLEDRTVPTTLNPGDLLVADLNAFGGSGGIVRVEPTTGDQTVVSSGGNFVDPGRITVATNGDLFVANAAPVTPQIIRVNPATGSQTIVSSGGNFVGICSIVIAANGDLLVADNGGAGTGGIFRVNPVTGVQTLVSSGDNFYNPCGLAMAANGDLFVSDDHFSDEDRVLRVDPVTGSQTVVTLAPKNDGFSSLALAANGDLFVTDERISGGPPGILRVDPTTGAQTIISQGGNFVTPANLAIAANGDLFVVDSHNDVGSSAVIRVDPSTGDQTVISSGGNFVDLGGIAIVPGAVSVNDVSIIEGNSGTKSAVFTAKLSAPTLWDVVLDYATADGTATAGQDYVASSGTLTIPHNSTTATISVPIIGDMMNEANETFFVNLSNPSNATIADGQGQGIITNDDPLPRLSMTNTKVTEGNLGTKNATFTVKLSAVSGQTVTVPFNTADGSAIAGCDYTATSGIVTFAPGVTSQTFDVAILGDTISERDESFYVDLGAPTNAKLSVPTGIATIVNDDNTISVSDVTLAEGNSGTTAFNFTVSLSAPATFPITVNYATANGTATAGSDYTAIPLTSLVFAAGETSMTVTVAVNGDTAIEPNETFFVNLSGPSNASIAKSRGTGKILDDDLSLAINDVSLAEGNSGTTAFNFTVSLSAAASFPVTLKYATANGTATAPSDYTAIGLSTLTFSAGQISKIVKVNVKGDTTIEPDETFFVNLSSPTSALIADSQGVGTIKNDDGPGAASNRGPVGQMSVLNGKSTGGAQALLLESLNDPALVTAQPRRSTARDLDNMARELAAMTQIQALEQRLSSARQALPNATRRLGSSLAVRRGSPTPPYSRPKVSAQYSVEKLHDLHDKISNSSVSSRYVDSRIRTASQSKTVMVTNVERAVVRDTESFRY